MLSFSYVLCTTFLADNKIGKMPPCDKKYIQYSSSLFTMLDFFNFIDFIQIVSHIPMLVLNFEPNVWILLFERIVQFWNWLHILKCFFTFFSFLLDRKEGWIVLQYFYWNHPTFSISWRCPKIHCTVTLKNTTLKMFGYSTPISTFNALSKWLDSRISEKLWLIKN